MAFIKIRSLRIDLFSRMLVFIKQDVMPRSMLGSATFKFSFYAFG